MARKTKKRTSSKRPWKSALPLWPNLGALVMVFGLLIGLVVLLMAAQSTTELRKQAKGCSLDSCNQCPSGGNYIIRNQTNCPAEPDGDQQVCGGRGRVGLCGGQQWCCPGAGQRWTTDMSACAGNTYSGPCISPVTPTKTPTQTPTQTPTNSPTQTPTQTPTRTPTPTTRIVYNTATPKPTVIVATSTLTPTPTSYILNSCNKSCGSDADCPGGLVCNGGIFGLGKSCRNPYCKDTISCLCSDGTGMGQLSLVPTINELDPMGSGRQIVLTVSTFTDKNGLSNDRPNICGRSEPDAKITVTVLPDGASGTVTANSVGNWCWRPDKPLVAGAKNLSVVAQKSDGQGSVKQAFTVVASRPINWWGIIILLMVISAVGFGGYVYYKSM